MMQEVLLDLQGPYTLRRAHLAEASYDYGIYQITRITEGAEELLYIGRTRRSLALRIQEHSWWLSQENGEVRIRFGRFKLASGQRFSLKRFHDVECLLIVTLAPQYNRRSHITYYGRRGLSILSQGRRGFVPPSVSADQLLWG